MNDGSVAHGNCMIISRFVMDTLIETKVAIAFVRWTEIVEA